MLILFFDNYKKARRVMRLAFYDGILLHGK